MVRFGIAAGRAVHDRPFSLRPERRVLLERPYRRQARAAAGFSLVEVTVVLGIMLVVGMVAVPNMVVIVSNARLRAGVTSMSGLMQSCRMTAVKENRTLSARFATDDGTNLVAYVKQAPDTSARSSTDMQVEWEAPVIKMSAPTGTGAPSQIATSVLGFTPLTGDPSFNTRGLPCVYSSGTCTNNGFLYYFKDTSRDADQGWAALSISPAGRIKKWFWNGAEWTD